MHMMPFGKSEKPIRGCQYDLEPSRPFRLTEYCREYHRHCLHHVTSLYEHVPVSLRASRSPFSFRIRSCGTKRAVLQVYTVCNTKL